MKICFIMKIERINLKIRRSYSYDDLNRLSIILKLFPITFEELFDWISHRQKKIFYIPIKRI